METIEKLDYQPPLSREERKEKRLRYTLTYVIGEAHGRSQHTRHENRDEL